MTHTMTETMETARNSYHRCLIQYEVAMYRLMMLGLTAPDADKFLACRDMSEHAPRHGETWRDWHTRTHTAEALQRKGK